MVGNEETTFGDLLRSFRTRGGLTQEELAERAGLSTDAIGLLERGERRRPQRHTVQRLAEALALADAERAQLDAARGNSAAPHPPATPAQAALPLPATTFVGRVAERTDLARLLEAPQTRLVTLTGPGGVGKTRLALEVAAHLADRFADGVVFVSLAPLRDPALVPDAIIGALGVIVRGRQTPLGAATGWLGSRRTLLILDNCEHLLPAAPLAAALLRDCPCLTILATSRVRLHLTAEHQFPLPPLLDADATPAANSAGWAQHPAVALFAQRAATVAPRFALTPEMVPTVAAICRRLDGLPLAIELAAAWAKVLPPHALLARLDRALPLLADGPRDLPARQRNLRDTLAWSYGLLAPGEQTLLRHLGVFAGGWTLAAAEAVCTPSEPAAVLARLAALGDASLVRPPAPATAPTAGEPRYTLLETVREYAAELLTREPAGQGEEDGVRRRHAAHFLALVEEAQPHLVGPEEGAWLARLEEEGDNLRAALGWALDRREAAIAVRFAAVLWRFWAARGHLAEGHRWLEAILALASTDGAQGAGAEPVPPLRRAMLLHVTAIFVRLQGDYTRAEALFAECLAIRRAHDDQPGIVGALHNLGITAYERGDHARAVRLCEEVLPLARQEQDSYGIAFILTTLGEAVQATGDTAIAMARYEEGLDWFRRIGHTWGIALALTRLGDAALVRGERDRAAALHRESLAHSAALGDPQSATDALEGLAHAEVDADPALAARLLGAAGTLRDRLGVPRPLARQAEQQRAEQAARAALGEAGYATAHAAGAALTLEQALTLAQPPPIK